MIKPVIGIIGAGKLGITLAQLGLRAGYKVHIAGSTTVKKIALTVEILTPGAVATETAEAVRTSDVIILAMPLGKFRSLPASLLNEKLVIDGMNHWSEVDGGRDEIIENSLSSSEAVQAYFNDATIIKAFSHMGYHDLHDFNRPKGAADRKAIALAGNDANAIETVKTIIDDFGFDPLHIGPLSAGTKLEPGNKAFGANLSLRGLDELIKS